MLKTIWTYTFAVRGHTDVSTRRLHVPRSDVETMLEAFCARRAWVSQDRSSAVDFRERENVWPISLLYLKDEDV